MADSDFEEFRVSLESTTFPKETVKFYSLVHDVILDEESPTRSDPELDCDINQDANHSEFYNKQTDFVDNMPQAQNGERRRRKLPEIPKDRKSSVITAYSSQYRSKDGLGSSGANSVLVIKCGHLWETDSPDSDHFMTDADSGHSTVHSPTGTEGFKSLSPVLGSPSTVEYGPIHNNIDVLEATHRGLHKFVSRHSDEIDVEIGDPIYVQKEADDLWCEGVNLRTGRIGIFPSAYAVDCDYSDWESTYEHNRKERYLLGYLGSVETLTHKGTSVVCQAVKRVTGNSENETDSQPCILEISDQGLRMVDRRKGTQNRPCIDYFYSLKNVSFCAFHPRDHRYLGFITKHPTLQRFACHVFRGTDSTRPVAEAVGRAFQRFYQKFIETAYPIEDIYIE